jgi:hypothetical protein
MEQPPLALATLDGLRRAHETTSTRRGCGAWKAEKRGFMRWRLGVGKRPTLGLTLLRPEVLGNLPEAVIRTSRIVREMLFFQRPVRLLELALRPRTSLKQLP